MKLSRADKKLEKSGLTEKQKAFCREYVIDWNATQAYLKAYPDITSVNVAGAASNRLLRNVKIRRYCEEIQNDLEKLCGVSKAKIINEHLKLIRSSIAHLHNTWIERKHFESLTDEQKACISEISTQIRTQKVGEEEFVDIDFVKIKLYDKQKALDSISKMMGYDAATKMQVEVQEKDMPDINIAPYD